MSFFLAIFRFDLGRLTRLLISEDNIDVRTLAQPEETLKEGVGMDE